MAHTRDVSAHLGHTLMIGDITGPRTQEQKHLSNSLICCTRCGAYAHASPHALFSKCLGKKAGAGLKNQKGRLSRGLYPSTNRLYMDWRIGNFRAATPNQVGWLTRPSRPLGFPLTWGRCLRNRWNERILFLVQFGLDESSLNDWSAALPKRMKGSCDEVSSDEELFE